MKPTEKQKKIIDFLIDQLKCWRDSNDIYSPTLYSDMEECFEELKDDIKPIYICLNLDVLLLEYFYLLKI